MIILDEGSRTPLYEQIYQQIKRAIETGNLAIGANLPATRVLAEELCVGRGTVENAYHQLLAEGYVSSRIGSGFTVMDISEDMYHSKHKTNKNINTYYSDVGTVERDRRDNRYPPVRYDFHFKNICSEVNSNSQWRKYNTEFLYYYENNNGFCSYSDKQGEYDLRLQIRKYLYEFRAVECDVDRIVVSSGLQFTLDTICKLMPKEYHCIGFEEPGYELARVIFERNGFKITPLPIYPNADPSLHIESLQKERARTLFLTPSHQFPTGYILSISARNRLLKWAQDNDCYIIEDDYDSVYRFNSRPIPALYSIDSDDRVIYLGSFSKVLSPSLRISYMVLPKHLVPIYRHVFSSFQPSVAWLQQKSLAMFMEDRRLERHFRKTFQLYKKRHNHIIQTINKLLGNNVKIIGHNAGLHFMLKVNGAKSQEELVHRAREQEVRVYPTTPYWMIKKNCPADIIMIGYAQLSHEDIDKGIARLRNAWFE